MSLEVRAKIQGAIVDHKEVCRLMYNNACDVMPTIKAYHILQYTGVTNYSGIKIFEGDKLKANDNFYLHQEITVKYDPESGFFPRDFVGDIRNYEVIGNIYDK